MSNRHCCPLAESNEEEYSVTNVRKSVLYFICTSCELTSTEKAILHLLVALNGCEISEKKKKRERGNACVNGTDYHQMALLSLHGRNKNNGQTFIITSTQ
jgi:hypothetical protein